MTHRMKQFRSTYQDLRDLFGRDITAEHILEQLQSCHADENAACVRERMKNLDFDVIGMEDEGEVDGYVKQESLKSGPCRKYKKKFTSSELIEKATPLTDVFSALYDAPRKFVMDRTKVTGIVTRGDLRKAPVRMWLFGLVTLLEMHFLRLIRGHYHQNSWVVHLTRNRITKAKGLFALRKERNEAIDLADCLQFCDKRKLILKTPVIRESIRREFGESAESMLVSAEKLRDRLCHAQDIVEGSTWPEVIDTAKSVERFLDFLENYEVTHPHQDRDTSVR